MVGIKYEMTKTRDSNIELYRIIAMLLIVMHHLILHSGTIEIASGEQSVSAMLANLLGMWGKIGINCYLMITGYYICTSNISLRKWLKLLLWIWFYNALINSIFMLTGYVDFTIHTLLRVFLPISRVGNQFASTFVVFYLFIPFLNIAINNMSKQMYQYLLMLVVLIFIVLPYFPVYTINFNYLLWFACVYLFAAYLRLHYNQNNHNWGIATIICVCLSITSVVVGTYSRLWQPFYLVADSNALLALPTAICSFMYMKQVKIGINKVINTIAASCFGVLLIHDNSSIMHQWLWHDAIQVSGLYYQSILSFVVKAFLIVFIVYTICTLIDMIRLYVIEKPIFKIADRHLGKYKIWFNA